MNKPDPVLFELTGRMPVETASTGAERDGDVVISADQERYDALRASLSVVAAEEVRQVELIGEWAEAHTVTDVEDAATLGERGLETGVPVAGVGAPLVSDFALMELAAHLGRTYDSARAHVGRVLELTHRLPGVWTQVRAGRVPLWKGLRVADHTIHLNPAAVAFVDRHLAVFARGCSWAQVERLVEEAVTRHDPDAAEERRRDAGEHRRFDVDLDQAGTRGTVAVSGVLDTADALDLDQAIRERATVLGRLGCADSLDVRRSLAVGEIARQDLALDLTTGEVRGGDGGLDTPSSPGGSSSRSTNDAASLVVGRVAGSEERGSGVSRPSRRPVELFVHLTRDALTDPETNNVGRLANLRTPVTVEQIRAWCGAAGTIIVRPVVDLTGHEPVDAYDIPDRHRRQVALRDGRCVFPHCHRPATSCDIDLTTPYGDGGVTCPCNEAALCRRHHRLKTHHGWTYHRVAPATYQWTDRSRRHWTVEPTGTTPPDL